MLPYGNDRAGGYHAGGPYPGTANFANFTKRVGGTQCRLCSVHPTHTLLPCGHTVCYDHFLADDHKFPMVCAFCFQPVENFVQIVPDFQPYPYWTLLGGSTPTHPELSIWGAASNQNNYQNPYWGNMAPIPMGDYLHSGAAGGTHNPSVQHGSHDPGMQHGSHGPGVQHGNHDSGKQQSVPNKPKHARFPSFHPNQPWNPEGTSDSTKQPTPWPAFHPAGRLVHPSMINQDGSLRPEAYTAPGSEYVDPQNEPGHFRAGAAGSQPAHSRSARDDPVAADTSAQPSHAARDNPIATQTSAHFSRTECARAMSKSSVPGRVDKVPSTQAIPTKVGPSMMNPNKTSGPTTFRPSHAFRELKTPDFTAGGLHSGSFDTQNGSGPVQAPVNMRPPARDVTTSGICPPSNNSLHHNPANISQYSGMFSNNNPAQRNNSNMPNMYPPVYQSHFAPLNGTHLNGTHLNGPPIDNTRMDGQRIDNNNLHMNGQRMGTHLNNGASGYQRHMNGMYGTDIGPSMIGNYHHMNGAQFGNNIAVGLPAEKGDPFVDDVQRKTSGNAITQRLSTFAIHQPASFSSPPRADDPSRIRSPQQIEAARLAQAIKSGHFETPGAKSPQSDHSYVAPSTSSSQSGLFAVPIVRSQAVMSPDILPDPPFVTEADSGVFPTPDEAFEYIPFVDAAHHKEPSTSGVIKITNIPYSTTKNEVVAALGRSTRIANMPSGTPYYGIHIIMDRPTGKTMDCFVELDSLAEAKNAIASFQQRCANDRQPRIGDRHVDMTLSSQEELMKELFPRAKCVKWEGQIPTIFESDEPYNSGFSGFINSEEMVMMAKHAETPQRSPFAQRCVNRTYETMISILHKYPWFSGEYITMTERMHIYHAVTTQLRVLILSIMRNNHAGMLTPTLLQEFLIAVLSNPGFSVQQKNHVVEVIHSNNFGEMLALVPYVQVPGNLGSWWCFEVLSKKPEVSDTLLDYFLALIRTGTMPINASSSLAERAMALRSPLSAHYAKSPFGHMAPRYPKELALCTLAEVAKAEWDAVEIALKRALPANRAIEGGEVLALPAPEDGLVGKSA